MADVTMPKPRNIDKELRKTFGGAGADAMLAFLNKANAQSAATSVNNLVELGDRVGGQLDKSGLLADLTSKAKDELALGGGLSAEEARDVTQAARLGFADRGLVMSNPAIVNEVLNRQQYVTLRDASRKQFALQAAGLEQNQDAQILGYLNGSGDAGAAATNSLLGYSADLHNTNLNMQASVYNQQQNNQASAAGAKTSSNATRNAALIGAGGAIVAGALIVF